MTPSTAAGRDRAAGVDAEIMRTVERLSAGGRYELVWTNPVGGRTFRLCTGGEVQYLKFSPPGRLATHDPLEEAERLEWIGTRLPVPEVVDVGRSAGLTWMRTREVPGLPASHPRWLAEPRRTAGLTGEATRQFHDALADLVDACPFSWRIADRVRRRLSGADAERADAEHTDAVRTDAPPEIDLVVAHGDLCAPNILLTDDGNVGGFVDLGTLGVADRAADLGTGLWSLEFNGMAELAGEFLAAYGYDGDPETIRWYRDFYATG